MNSTEVITRLCEMAAELAEMSQKYEGKSDVHFYLNTLEQSFQKTLQEMQDSEN